MRIATRLGEGHYSVSASDSIPALLESVFSFRLLNLLPILGNPKETRIAYTQDSTKLKHKKNQKTRNRQWTRTAYTSTASSDSSNGGLYHLTGLVHVSEVSWDLVQDVRDILTEGDDVRVKLDGSADSDSLTTSNSSTIEPLPGLDAIFKELLQEDGINDVRISRPGFEKRVVSQDYVSYSAPPSDNMFTLLARAGRQAQEIQLATSLDQEGIKKALQRVLERVP
ncbi:hypothetical protein J1N35_013044 [Gossypium stocksii]|uniref:S1 motif domain-containing protein n=1 Tax=Gossypium stocksii TaxID=47602 RepID=A0A9D4A6B5_9ROSI|nr:hypothetical protein J1N35_013044 [Gossypium stocksii]